jgi:hypothetical protein
MGVLKDQYLKIQDEKKTLEDRLHFLEEFGPEQCNNTTTGADFTDDLDRNGKRSSLFDEVQELLDIRGKETINYRSYNAQALQIQ